MHFLVLSDIHANMEYFDALESEFAKADAVLFAGDFTNPGEDEKAADVLAALIKKNDALFAVTGNCDKPDFLQELEKRDVSVQGTMVFRDGLFFAGSGGALTFTGTTPNERSEEELLGDLQMVCDRSGEYEPYPFDDEDKAQDGESSGESVQGGATLHDDTAATAADTDKSTTPAPVTASAQSTAAATTDAPHEWQNLILIIHQPPYDTKVDIIPSGAHVGSKSLRTFIEEYRPLVAVSGHVHESSAIDTLGPTTLINPGSLAEGNYALLEVQKQNGNWKVIKAELKQL